MQRHNRRIRYRAATAADRPWLWSLYRDLLKPAIDAQWGWDETYQRRQFRQRLPTELFTIVECNGHSAAAYALRDNTSHLYLHLLLVAGDYQLQGLGTAIINAIKTQARKSQLPLELSTFPANPVDTFYHKNGFDLIETTAERHRFRWIAGS